VYVGCNGRSWNIPTGVAVPVPEVVVNILNDAVEDRVKREFDPALGRFISRVRQVKRFNFQVLSD